MVSALLVEFFCWFEAVSSVSKCCTKEHDRRISSGMGTHAATVFRWNWMGRVGARNKNVNSFQTHRNYKFSL